MVNEAVVGEKKTPQGGRSKVIYSSVATKGKLSIHSTWLQARTDGACGVIRVTIHRFSADGQLGSGHVRGRAEMKEASLQVAARRGYRDRLVSLPPYFRPRYTHLADSTPFDDPC